MMKKAYIIGVFALVLLMAIQAVSASFLEISDVDVKVGSKSESGITASGGRIDNVEPGDKIQVKLKVRNTYESAAADPEITDIEVTGDIENMDDGDDLEPDTEPDEFDLEDAGDSKRITLEYSVPIRVDEDDYDLVIDIDGLNNTNVKQNASISFVIEVNKESHKLMFSKAAFDREKAACDKAADFSVLVYNIGSEDEEEVKLTISSEELNILTTEQFDIDSGGVDEDTEFGKTYKLSIPTSAKAGTYTILAALDYRNGGKKETKSVDLLVECEEKKAEPAPAKAATTTPAAATTVTTTPVTTTTVMPTTVPATTGAFKATPVQKSFSDKYGLALIIAGYAVGIVILLLIIVYLRKR